MTNGKKYFKKILCGLGIASFLFSPISNVYANSQDMSKETRALGTYTGNVKLNVSTAVDQIKNVGTTGRFHS